jgi:FMN phosphatase YigB (HAD superfamily)/ribulose-5-phosphate 4-epimerase/fuculose-1-phosphate aldolase
MFYKGVIFDLDNTIYNYDSSHKKAIHETFLYIIKNSNIEYKTEEVKEIYETVSTKIKYELSNTASSHNKGIYFKQLLERLLMPLAILPVLNEIYWDTFYNTMECFVGVKEFISWNKKNGIKIGILTDYETEYQVQKLIKLDLIQYCDIIITSEEVGIEKPSSQMFQTILRKLNLSSDEVIMIGDNFDKDIMGASNMNILSYWFHEKNEKYQKYIEFNSFINLHNEFKETYAELVNLKRLSRFAGERFDLVQAGGGNSSVKVGEWMFIKASGVNMANVDTKNGYVPLNNKRLLNDIKQNCTKDVTKYNVFGNKRASIETFMHATLKKYTLHLHPIQVNRLLITKEAKIIVTELFPEALIIDYLTPGIQICNEIVSKYNGENLLFLINHGIIVTSDSFAEIFEIVNKVITKFEKKQNMNYDKYKYTNILSNHINSHFDIDNVSYLSENYVIANYLLNNKPLFDEKITFPDALIYCGIKILFINKLTEINTYYEDYGELPKIIIINNNVYISSISLSKCRDIEEVLLSNLIVLDSNSEKNYLSKDEICFLNNWDSEKYRKML